jgi:hypothetical protein
MKLIEPDEMEDFHKVLARFKLSAKDFDLVETDTTDPQSDEIFGLTGFVTITRKSTGKQNHYPIGDGSTWVAQFQRDIVKKIFD